MKNIFILFFTIIITSNSFADKDIRSKEIIKYLEEQFD